MAGAATVTKPGAIASMLIASMLIADLLNKRGLHPGGSARRGKQGSSFTALRVAYLVHQYELRPRYDRLRDRGMLTKEEMAARLGIHVHTLIRWAEHGLVTRHAYNGHAFLYEPPGQNPPLKQSSRWNRLVDRANQTGKSRSKSSRATRGGAV
ncbi:MAG TPA: hypothetical protein VGD37_20750 [Kofleriaceae bacterium]